MPVLPIFLSSTFRDFHAERDRFISDVVPAIDERIAHLGCRVEVIDLRWGVSVDADEDEVRQARVLEVCLGEIERSRPLFVGLLGDRYGWIPDQRRARTATAEAGFDDAPAGVSVTALEIEFGALRADGVDTVFLERHVSGAIPEGWRDSDQTRITNLKSRVRQSREVHEYAVTVATGGTPDLSEFVERAVEVVGRHVEAHAVVLAGQGKDPVVAAERLFFEDRLRAFGGRRQLLQAVVDRLRGGDGVCLTGESGVGKSAIWCAAVEDVESAGGRVIAVPIGASPEVTGVPSVVARIAKLAAVRITNEVSEDELRAALRKRLAQLGPVTLAVDALDQLPDGPNPSFLADLPANVTLLTSTTSPAQAHYLGALGSALMPILPLSEVGSAEAVMAICGAMGRSLPESAVRALASRGRTPLWLRLAVGELTAMSVDHYSSVDPGKDSLEEVARLVTATIADLPEEVGALIDRIIARAGARFGENEVSSVLVLLSASRSGLRPSDLEILTRLGTLELAGIRRALSGILVRSGENGRIGCSHSAVRARLVERFGAFADVTNRRLADYFATRGREDGVCREDRLWHLFRSGGVFRTNELARALSRIPRDDWRRMASVVLDSLDVADLEEALNGGPGPASSAQPPGIDAAGVEYLAWIAHEFKSVLLSSARIRLCLALFAAARAHVDAGNVREPDLLALANAASCLGDLPAAVDPESDQLAAARKALAYVRAKQELLPNAPEMGKAVALIAMWVGQEATEPDERLQCWHFAVAAWQRMYDTDPSDHATAWLSYALEVCGSSESDRGNHAQARVLFERAASLCRSLIDSKADFVGMHVNLINALGGIGESASALGDGEVAAASFREAIELAEAEFRRDPSRGATDQLAITGRRYGLSLLKTRDFAPSAAVLSRSEEMFGRLYLLDPNPASLSFQVDTVARAAVAQCAAGEAALAHARSIGAVHQAEDTDVGFRQIQAVFVTYLEHWLAKGDERAPETVALARLAVDVTDDVFDTAELDATELAWNLRNLGIPLVRIAAALRRPTHAEFLDFVGTVVRYWTRYLPADVGGDSPNCMACAESLVQISVADASHRAALMEIAERYAARAVETRADDEKAVTVFAIVCDVAATFRANDGDLEEAALRWLWAAPKLERKTTDPQLLSMRASIINNLRRVSNDRIPSEIASLCRQWAAYLDTV